MAKSKIYSSSWRQRKAYWTAFVVMMSYGRLYFLGKLFGTRYYEKRITALHLKNAHRVKKAILQLEGLFIKVGQLLSILTNFLPEAFQEPLEALQNQLPPRPFSEIQRRIQEEFGQAPAALFAAFEEHPLAAASIGQAHRARLKDGTEVVVKVQHTNIEAIAEVDLKIIQRLNSLVARFFDIKGIEHAYEQVRKMIEEELDFRQEAQSMERIREQLAEEAGLHIPQVHAQYSTNRVLTTTFYPGVKISELAQIDRWGLNRRALAERLVNAYCQMVFRYGFYHADPHPGNILVQENGDLVLLDFGAVASLRPEMRDGFLELIEAAAKNDTEKIITVLKTLGFLADGHEADRIAGKIVDAFRNFLQNEVQFEGLNFKDIKVSPFETSLFNLLSEIGLRSITNTVQVPKEYVLLNRMVTLLLGICNALDPQVNPLKVIRPYFQEFILGKNGNVVQFVTDLIKRTLTDALALPGELRQLMRQANRGQLEIQITGRKEHSLLLYALGQQRLFAFLLIAAAAFGYWLHQNEDTDWAYASLALAGLCLLLLLRAASRAARLRKQLLD
ncbi:MAG: AarF/UbiB family protein [Bacteroidota bacterium]